MKNQHKERLSIRISPGRMLKLRKIASEQEKTLTAVIEELIDGTDA